MNSSSEEENINQEKIKDEYYKKLLKYNKKIHKDNLNKDNPKNSEIKIFPKPSQAPNKEKIDENQFLTIISRQKKNSNNSDEIEIQPLEKITKKTFQEKAMEENLESKYGKGYKILKMAGYQLGKGLGKEEQGITDPILVKKRKERAGINNDEDYENVFDLDKKNNFILGKKRLNEDKNYEETNEEFKNFDLLLDEFKKDKNNDKKIWSLLDEDRRIKKKYHGKVGRFFGFANFRKKFKEEFPELKGKEIEIKNIEKYGDEKEKEILAKMLWVTKDKIVDKLRQYYENENNKFIYENVHNNTDNEKNKIASNLDDKIILFKKMKEKKIIYKEPDKHKDLESIINYIDEYINLSEINPILYTKLLNNFSLYCLKTTIIFIEEMKLDIISLLDKERRKKILLIFKKMKKLLFNTFNQEGINLDEEEDNNKNNKYLSNQKNYNYLDEDDLDKASDYFNMFISRILFNKLIFYIGNKWNVHDSKPIINYNHLYSDILSKSFIDILYKKISSSIINYINKVFHFIPPSNSNSNIDYLKIHTWIHPLLDILSEESLVEILNLIEQKIKNSIKNWNINNSSHSELLINILSPWTKLFGDTFWKDLYKKYFLPNFHKMFSNLYLRIDENVEDIYSIKLLFTLNDKRFLPSKKYGKILKKFFFDKMKSFIKECLRKNRDDIEKNQVLAKWCIDAINYFKTKNNIYVEIKENLNDCLLMVNIE